MTSLRTPAAQVAVLSMVLTLAAAPGGRLAAALAVPVPVVLLVLVFLRDRLGVRRVPWAPWVMGLSAAGLVVRLSGGSGSPALALELGCVAAACVALERRAAWALGVLAVLLQVTARAWARGDANQGLEGLWTATLSVVVVCAVVSFVTERLRRRQEQLREGLAALTSVQASPAPGEAPTVADVAAPHGLAGDRELARLLELARRAVAARSVVLFERVVEPPEWRVAAGASVAEDFDGLASAPLGHGLIAWAARHGGPLRLSQPGPQLRALPWYSGGGDAGSFVGLPLEAGPAGRPAGEEGGGAWAVLACDSPLPQRFDDESLEALELHAAEIAARIALHRELARRRRDREAVAGLPAAARRLEEAGGSAATAKALLEEAAAVGAAPAGGVVVAGSVGEGGGSGSGAPLLAAGVGLEVADGTRLEPEEETWATWSLRHPDSPVRIAAFGPDRGLPRVARGDGLDAAWSLATWPLVRAGEEASGVLALAWPQRALPDGAVLEAVEVLAAVGGATLAARAATERMGLGRRHDALTGLPGRGLLLADGERHARWAAEEGGWLSGVAFGLAELDGLWREGDGLAWEDAVEAGARALVAALPASARAYRFGEDEVVALLPGASSEGAMVAARRAVGAAASLAAAGRPLTVRAAHATYRAGEEDFPFYVDRLRRGLAAARAGRSSVLEAPPT